jgi:putative membrane protein
VAAVLVVVAAASAAAVPQGGGNMQSLAAKFLTDSEKQAVTKIVQEAEKQTSGEIVPMIVSASHHYPLAAATGATLISLPLALLLTSFFGSALWLGSQNMYLFLVFFALLYLPIRAVVSRTPAVKRVFLSNRQVEEEVEEAAITSFYGEKLYRTRDQNGILLFVSVFERRVWILGDAGINERIEPGQWQEIVDNLTKGIRDGRQCEALCQAITCVGDILKKHFPIRQDDSDELHNIIIR